MNKSIKSIKSIMIFLTAMIMTVGSMSMTAYANDTDAITGEQKISDELVRVNGTFENGSVYTCYPNSLLRISNPSFTSDEFYKIVKENSPKSLVLTDADISGDNSEVNEWFNKLTSGELGIETVLVTYKINTSILDKYNKMIDSLAIKAASNGENTTATDLKFKYKLFFYNKSTGELSGPDGIICENCHYIDMTEMKAYPNNKGILAAVESPDYVNDEDETIIDEIKVLARAEQIGDANSDGKMNVRDCAYIANALANGKADSLPDTADYNKDGKKNVRDAAAISKDLASK